MYLHPLHQRTLQPVPDSAWPGPQGAGRLSGERHLRRGGAPRVQQRRRPRAPPRQRRRRWRATSRGRRDAHVRPRTVRRAGGHHGAPEAEAAVRRDPAAPEGHHVQDAAEHPPRSGEGGVEDARQDHRPVPARHVPDSHHCAYHIHPVYIPQPGHASGRLRHQRLLTHNAFSNTCGFLVSIEMSKKKKKLLKYA